MAKIDPSMNSQGVNKTNPLISPKGASPIISLSQRIFQIFSNILYLFSCGALGSSPFKASQVSKESMPKDTQKVSEIKLPESWANSEADDEELAFDELPTVHIPGERFAKTPTKFQPFERPYEKYFEKGSRIVLSPDETYKGLLSKTTTIDGMEHYDQGHRDVIGSDLLLVKRADGSLQKVINKRTPQEKVPGIVHKFHEGLQEIGLTSNEIINIELLISQPVQALAWTSNPQFRFWVDAGYTPAGMKNGWEVSIEGDDVKLRGINVASINESTSLRPIGLMPTYTEITIPRSKLGAPVKELDLSSVTMEVRGGRYEELPPLEIGSEVPTSNAQPFADRLAYRLYGYNEEL